MIDSKFDALKNKIEDRKKLTNKATATAFNMTIEEKNELTTKVATLDGEITALIEEYVLEPIDIIEE